MPPPLQHKNLARFGGALLLFIIIAAYTNHFHNSFHFDDAHTIENNAAIREIKNIPLFFSDARSFSSLPSNQSYRPLVSTLLAIDYKLGGLNPFWFHLSIFALFIALVLPLAFLIYRLIDPPTDGFAAADNLWIALGAVALYGLHPANADTVNYIVASAEIISTLGIVASFVIYLKFPKAREYYFYALPAALAILAKPPAAIFPVLFAIYFVLFERTETRGTATRLQRFLEIAVPFVVCALTLLFVQHMTPRSWVAGARDADNYLITQPYIALLYFKTFFWPNDLSADYDLNPFTSTNDPRFWAGVLFVVLLVTMSILCARSKRTRAIAFGLLWFLICLLPTSLFPLAEPMNDHRTFLPYIGLIISLAGLVTFLFQTRMAERRPVRVGFCFAILLILSINGYATVQRNKVWKNEEALWRDVTIKSPRNSRGLMNYGNTLMSKGDYTGALDYFHRALALAPQYSVLFVNLAIAEGATNQTALAEQHFKEAMRLAPNSPDSYTYYARYLLAHARAAEAEPFVRSALALSPTDVTAHDLLKKAELAERTPESCLAASLQYYLQAHYEKSIAAAEEALKLRPDYAEAWNNICAANNQLGRFEEASKACEQALRLKPDLDLARNNLQYAKQHGP